MPTELAHLALHPHTHNCAHCEDPVNPVTPQNGGSITYRVSEKLDVEVFVHRYCANSWVQEFNLKLPKRINSLPELGEDPGSYADELRARLRQMEDSELLRYGLRAKYACSLESNDGAAPLETYVVQLQEARLEWGRRKRGTVIADSF
jgi:hypothetical protein